MPKATLTSLAIDKSLETTPSALKEHFGAAKLGYTQEKQLFMSSKDAIIYASFPPDVWTEVKANDQLIEIERFSDSTPSKASLLKGAKPKLRYRISLSAWD
jgi:hypothetical protein